LFVNEFQGALVEDLKSMIESLVAENDGYRHDDPRYSDCERGNAQSHLRAALLGRSVAVGISGGEPSLGRFRSTLFAELEGPRPRSIDVQIMGVKIVGGGRRPPSEPPPENRLRGRSPRSKRRTSSRVADTHHTNSDVSPCPRGCPSPGALKRAW